jgi:hypothetical protein
MPKIEDQKTEGELIENQLETMDEIPTNPHLGGGKNPAAMAAVPAPPQRKASDEAEKPAPK